VRRCERGSRTRLRGLYSAKLLFPRSTATMQTLTKFDKLNGTARRQTTAGATKTQLLSIDFIECRQATQIRASIDPHTVKEYAKALALRPREFPPVAVFFDGQKYILADGFYRIAAAKRNRAKEIYAEIHIGSQADALKYALSANTRRGLGRSYEDKRRSVALAFAQWPELSNREIARLCAVSDPFVANQRRKSPSPALGNSIGLTTGQKQRFRGRPAANARNDAEACEGPVSRIDDSEEAEAQRLQYLAETWPATCNHCDKEFRYAKSAVEPESCPACALTVRNCRLCGKSFETDSAEDFCSTQCASWYADNAPFSRAE